MFRFMKAKSQIRGVNRVIDTFVPEIPKNADVVERTATLAFMVTGLKSRAELAENALRRMQEKYEPTRVRVPGRPIQPVGL